MIKTAADSLAEELHGQEPGVAAEGPVLAAVGADAVVDLGDVRVDVLDARVVEAVDPQARVAALHLALEVVKGPRRVLQAGWRKHLKLDHQRKKTPSFSPSSAAALLQYSYILTSSVPFREKHHLPLCIFVLFK